MLREKLRFWTLVGLWAAAVVLVGGALTSLHQPMREPEAKILTLARGEASGSWRAVHFLSGSCGCSQRVMRHLLARGRFAAAAEEIVLVDGGEDYLEGSAALVQRLDRAGFRVTHVRADSISPDTGLHGVPLLVLARPDGSVAYMGGYGAGSDRDGALLEQAKAGGALKRLGIVGCAVGARLRGAADPLRLKYAPTDQSTRRTR
jgi:hypothetical protein